MVPLLGPVHAIAHEWSSAGWHFDTDGGQEIPADVGQFIVEIAARLAESIMAVARRVVVPVTADECLAVQQAAHDGHPEPACDMVVARAGRP